MSLPILAALTLGVLLLVAAISAPAIAWIDARTADITAERSRVSSSVQVVVTTAAFATAYALYPHDVPVAVLAMAIAGLFGLAVGGEIQAERLLRASAY